MTLVDMEAHEIFSICSKFVPVHDISIIKIVSDHMDGKEFFLSQVSFQNYLKKNG